MNYEDFYFFKILGKREIFDVVNKYRRINRDEYNNCIGLFKDMTSEKNCDEIDSREGNFQRYFVIEKKNKNTLYYNTDRDKYIICEEQFEIFKGRYRKCIQKYSFFESWESSTRMFDKIKV